MTLAQHKEAVKERAGEEEPLILRTLGWSKDAKSGRTLEEAPLFTEGVHVYTISLQKITAESVKKEDFPALVVEQYIGEFQFVSAVTLKVEATSEGLDQLFGIEGNKPEIIR